MLTKLKNKTITIFMNDGKGMKVPAKSIAYALAASMATKNIQLMENSFLFKGPFDFKKELGNHLDAAIGTVNELGLSTTFDTIEAMHPGKYLDIMLKEQSEHKDNPYYPFFEED
jgi:hypothetical protein